MIFSGNYEIQTIFFLLTIIFVIMLTAYHFGNILELNSYFQRILIAMNKITHGINYNHNHIQDIIWICIQTWNCIFIRNLGKLYEKLKCSAISLYR